MIRSYLSLFLILLSGSLLAQLGGESVFNSLNIPANARAASLGGSAIGIKDGDLNLAFFNPALLDSSTHGSFALSYVNYFSDVNFGYASYAHQLDSLTVIAGTLQYVDYGQFIERDVTSQEIGSFSAGDYAAIIGIGRQIDSSFTIGANVKFLYSTIDQYTSSAGAIDLAGNYFSKKRKFSASLLIRNLGTQFKSFNTDTREDLPLDIQFGISKQLKHAPLRFSIVADNLQKWDIRPNSEIDAVEIDPVTGEVINNNNFEFGDILMRHLSLGTEILISENFHFRFGYNYRRRQELKVAEKPGTAGFSYGLSMKISRFHLSYGRATYHLAGPSNHFTISTTLTSRK